MTLRYFKRAQDHTVNRGQVDVEMARFTDNTLSDFFAPRNTITSDERFDAHKQMVIPTTLLMLMIYLEIE